MTVLKSHSGGCHCGKVRYEVKLDLDEPVISCNCSMCGRSGTLLAFVPADRFTLWSGEDVLTDYQFNHLVIHHLFCRICGIKSFARGVSKDGSPTVAIDTRCLAGVDASTRKVMHFGGKNR